MARTGGLIRVAVYYALIVCTFASCGEPSRRPLLFDVQLPLPEVVVSLGSELIAGASGLALDSTSRLWIADFAGKRLISVRQNGADPILVGKEGAGPGEFRGPLGIVAGRDFIRVAEAFNNRLQDYTLDGQHISDYSPAIPMMGGAAMAADGRFVTPTAYGDSAFAVLHRLGSNVRIKFGQPVVPWTTYRSLEAQRNDARAGVVPLEVRNQLITGIGSDAAYLVLIGEGEVWQFDMDGGRRWRSVLDVPEVRKLRETFFEEARLRNDDWAPLVTLSQASEVGNTVWVLVGGMEGDPTTIYVLGRESGDLLGRVRIPTAVPTLKFVVNRDSARIFLSTPDDASIVRTNLVSVPTAYR